MNIFQNLALFSAAFGCALMAGLFFAYSVSVNPGLSRLPDAQYLAAMQSINRAILNPVFLLFFVGTPLLLGLSTILNFGTGARFWLLLGATLLYVFGTFAVTIGGNVPLNEALDAFSPAEVDAGALQQMRARFEHPWNRLHTIRTFCSALACAFSLAAALR